MVILIHYYLFKRLNIDLLNCWQIKREIKKLEGGDDLALRLLFE